MKLYRYVGTVRIFQDLLSNVKYYQYLQTDTLVR